MPRSGSAESGAHDDTSPVVRHASFSQVSWPTSPGRGITWNFHMNFPVSRVVGEDVAGHVLLARLVIALLGGVADDDDVVDDDAAATSW